jgi:opacity protein-like surface antigen
MNRAVTGHDLVLLPIKGAAVALPARSQFEGPYVFFFGGYTPGLPGNNGSEFAKLNSYSIGLGAGYNMQFGSIVFGPEGRVRKELGDRQIQDFANQFVSTLPIFIGSGSGDPNNFPPVPSGNRAIGNFNSSGTTYKRGGGGDLAWRVGVTPVDWLLLYGRVGLGAQEFTSTNITTSGTINCTNIAVTRSTQIFSPTSGIFFDTLVGCGSIQRASTSTITEQKSVVPYLTFGTGAEFSYNRFFVRAEAELQSFMVSGFSTGFFTNGTWMHMASGTVGVGLRF